MIYLDTHIVVWLYAGKVDILPEKTIRLINKQDLFISPMVRLELKYLNEIKRITVDSNTIVSELSDLIGLRICEKDFSTIINHALKITWTRDPFDRIIVANAAINNDILLTKDQSILDNYQKGFWA